MDPRRGVSGTSTPLRFRLDGVAAADAPLLVAMHGFRMNEDSFARLLRGLFDLPLHCLTFRAPLMAEPLEGESAGASWYDYDGDQERFRHELARVEGTLLTALGDAELQLDLRPRARVLLGFSQGGYAGAVIALRHPELFRGMIISGARVKHEILTDELASAARVGFEALLLHGERDASVPLAAARGGEEALRSAGLSVELCTFPNGHSLGRAQVSTIRAWLLARFE